jgi:ferredoxin-type protein NapH
MKSILRLLFPFFIGIAVALVTYLAFGWWGFLLIFPWIGGWISIGGILVRNRKKKEKDLGRRISILMAAPVFLVFIGIIEHENLQLEETVFYLAAGVFSRVLIHYSIAKVFGPLVWGRGFCGWACWTAALLDWLPIDENRPVPKKYTTLRYPVLALSILLPLAFIFMGYDFRNLHVQENSDKLHQLFWFLAGNGIYYALAVPMAFIFRKRRAFCKIACPVSLVMTPTTALAAMKRKPTGKPCNECGLCNRMCPMDVDVMAAIKADRKVASTECMYCGICKNVCAAGAIA